jgi:hypothetical protein
VTDPDPFSDLRSQRWNESAGERSPDCLGDEVIAALADGGLDPASRADAVRHAARCVHCRRSLASLARALESPEVAAAVPRVDHGGRRILRIGGTAAAAAILLIAVLGRSSWLDPSTVAHRAPATNSVGQPEAIAPLGAVTPPRLLRWRAVAGTDRYRVTLFHADGRVLYETELPDTSAPLPDSVTLSPGARYLWKVEARTGWNRWSASHLFEFSVAASRSR